MRTYKYRADGNAYRLDLTDQQPGPLPECSVRLKVHATSLNYRDLSTLQNLAGRKVDGITPLSDGAGEIVEVSPDVNDWTIGDRAAGCFFPTWLAGRFEMRHHKNDLGGSVDGMLAEEVILPADGLVRIPDDMTYAEAACLPCAAVTAWHALIERGELQAGESVLVLGTGGVSIFALQIAHAKGARVYVTSSSDDKLARARAMGATETINYKTTPDWDKAIWQLSDKHGIDHVIEVGGPGTLGKSMQCVAPGGQIALIGVLTGFGPPQDSLFPLLGRNVRLDGIYVGSRAMFVYMNQFFADHQIKPVIDREFPFEAAAEAFDYLASGQHFGKVVIRHDQ